MNVKIPFADQDGDIEGISTGLPQLNRIIGKVGGIPIDRMTLITGDFSTGKSSLALFMAGEAQQIRKEVLWIDSEGTFDKYHARMCKADPSKMRKLRQETYAEDLLNTVEDYVQNSNDTCVVIDSYGALSIRDEVEKDMSGADFGAKSKMFARFLRKVIPKLGLKHCTLIVIAHEYDKMGGAGGKVLVGGDAMRKFPSLWIGLKPKFGVVLKQGDKRVGDVLIATIKKNKTGGNRFEECDLQFIYGEGFNPQSDLLQDALEKNVITKTGNSYHFRGEKIGMISKLREWMKDETNAEKVKHALGTL